MINLFMGNSSSTYIHAHFQHRENILWLISISMTSEEYSREHAYEQLKLLVREPKDWYLEDVVDMNQEKFHKSISKYV